MGGVTLYRANLGGESVIGRNVSLTRGGQTDVMVPFMPDDLAEGRTFLDMARRYGSVAVAVFVRYVTRAASGAGAGFGQTDAFTARVGWVPLELVPPEWVPPVGLCFSDASW